MTTPTALCEIALEDPGDPPTWIDVTDFLRGFSYTVGRSTELDQVQASRGVIRLDNRDGRFDPSNGSSPYSPDVVPMRRIRLIARIDVGETAFQMRSSGNRDGSLQRGGLHDLVLFTGFVESWPQAISETNADDYVDVPAVDAFKPMSLAEFKWGYRYISTGDDPICGDGSGNVYPSTGTPHPPDDPSGTRIGRILDCMGWPATERDLDPGTVDILGSDVVFGGNTNITVSGTGLQHALDVASTEGGLFYVNAEGQPAFRDASYDPDLAPDDIWGDLSTEKRYLEIDLQTDDAQLWNQVSVAAGSLVATINVEDATSIARYFERRLSVTLVPGAVGGVAVNQDRADELLARHKDPILRVTRLRPKATTGTRWLDVLGRKLLDKLTVRVRPPGGLIEQDSQIEQYSVSSPNLFDWTVDWTLSAL